MAATEMKTYFNTYGPSLTEGEEVEMSVDYSRGGTSWFSGQHRPRGIRISFTPVKRAHTSYGMSKTSILGDDRGRAFVVRELNRVSDKQGREIADKVKPHAAELIAAAARQDWGDIHRQLSEIL